jgi:hypothetical protein
MYKWHGFLYKTQKLINRILILVKKDTEMSSQPALESDKDIT